MTQLPDVAGLLEQVQTAEELGTILDTVNDDQVADVVRQVGASDVLARVFSVFPERFEPARAGAGAAAVIQWNVTFDGESHDWVVDIADDICRTHAGTAPQPRLTLNLALPDFLRLVTARLNATQAFMGGKLRITGDVMFALQMQSWFGLS